MLKKIIGKFLIWLSNKCENKIVKFQQIEIMRLKEQIKFAEKTIDKLNYVRCEQQYLCVVFQEKVEKIFSNNPDVGLDFLELKEFLKYSYLYTNPTEFGNLATISKSYSEAKMGIPTFSWRGELARFRWGEFKFNYNHLNDIQWKSYPDDAHIFIEWIAHHTKMFEENKSGGSILKPYSVELGPC